MKNKHGTLIAICIVVFGMIITGYSLHQINKGAEEEPDDYRTSSSVTYDETGNVTSVTNYDISNSNSDGWSRPLMSHYITIVFLMWLLIAIFGMIACYSEGSW